MIPKKNRQKGHYYVLQDEPSKKYIIENSLIQYYDIDAILCNINIKEIHSIIRTNINIRIKNSHPLVRNYISDININEYKSIKIGYINLQQKKEISVFLLSEIPIRRIDIEDVILEIIKEESYESRMAYKSFYSKNNKNLLLLKNNFTLFSDKLTNRFNCSIYIFLEIFGTKKLYFSTDIKELYKNLESILNINDKRIIVDLSINHISKKPNTFVFPKTSFFNKQGIIPNYYQFMSYLYPSASYYYKTYEIRSEMNDRFRIQKYNFYSDMQDMFENIKVYYPRVTKATLLEIINNKEAYKDKYQTYITILENIQHAIENRLSFGYRTEYRLPITSINEFNEYFRKNYDKEYFYTFNLKESLRNVIININNIINEMKKVNNIYDLQYLINLENILVSNIIKGSIYKIPFSNYSLRCKIKELYGFYPKVIKLTTFNNRLDFHDITIKFLTSLKHIKENDQQMINKLINIENNLYNLDFLKELLIEETTTTELCTYSKIYYNPVDFFKNIYSNSDKISIIVRNIIRILEKNFNLDVSEVLISNNEFKFKEIKKIIRFDRRIMPVKERDILIKKTFKILEKLPIKRSRWTENDIKELSVAKEIYILPNIRENMFFSFNLNRSKKGVAQQLNKIKDRKDYSFEPMNITKRLKILSVLIEDNKYNEFITEYVKLVKNGGYEIGYFDEEMKSDFYMNMD